MFLSGENSEHVGDVQLVGGTGQVLGLLRELEVTLPYKSHSAG